MSTWDTRSVPRANTIVFKMFLVTIFFLYYQTRFIPGTVHTWLMGIGMLLTLPIMSQRYMRGDIRVPLDYAVLLAFLSVIVLGFVANLSTVVWLDFQAYVLMLLTYVYVRENASEGAIEFMGSLVPWFLLINGVFVILQLLTGELFPARMLGADPPRVIASGVSDGPTKNGMLISMGLSFMYAKLVFRRLRFTTFDGVCFTVGLVSLLGSASRAGLVSFAAVLAGGMLFMLWQTLRRRELRGSVKRVAITVALVSGLIIAIEHWNLTLEALIALRDPEAARYGLDVMLYKLTVFQDGSLEERFGTIAFFWDQMREFPLNALSVGFGTGTFITKFGLNIHNSYLEMLFTTGIVGLCLFLFLNLHVVAKALRKPGVVEITPVLFMLASVTVFMASHDVLRGRVFWIPLGLTAAFAYARPYAAGRRSPADSLAASAVLQYQPRYHG